MPNVQVPDSTDWLATPLYLFAAVEAALRCQICKDFYKTPMITSCSHTFCSLCIRRALSNDGKCPLCRAPEQELKLRSNWSVEEASEAFAKSRPSALIIAQEAASLEPAHSKRKTADADTQNLEPDAVVKRRRISARLKKNRETIVAKPPVPTSDEDEDQIPDSEDEFIPENPDNLVPCPICQTIMKEWHVFRHLETCEGPSTKPRNRISDQDNPSSRGSQRQHQSTLERLPALNYSMLKETVLRKKMTELRISNQGHRSLLEKRHKEWTTLWNANCDAARPKKRSDLLQDLDNWERTQGGRALSNNRLGPSGPAVKNKAFDGAAWAVKHDSAFKDLIAEARKSRKEATSRSTEGGIDQAQDGKAVVFVKAPQAQLRKDTSELRDDDGSYVVPNVSKDLRSTGEQSDSRPGEERRLPSSHTDFVAEADSTLSAENIRDGSLPSENFS